MQNRLVFEFDWAVPEFKTSSEIDQSFAELEITCGDEILTRNTDRTSRSERRRLYVPLYPLAEWLTENWWQLNYEVWSPGRQMNESFEYRHDFKYGRGGFGFPDLRVSPSESGMSLSWYIADDDVRDISYISSGRCFLPIEEFQSSLTRLLDAVDSRLVNCGIEKTPFQEMWQAIRSLDESESEFCEVAGSMGLNPFLISEENAAELESSSESFPEKVFREFAMAAEPQGITVQSDELLGIWAASSNDQTELKPLKALKEKITRRNRSSLMAPWQRGYDLAREVRGYFGGSDRFEEIELLENHRVHTAAAATLPFEGVVATNSANSPIVTLIRGANSEYSTERMRFSASRALYQCLTQVEEIGLVTKAYSDVQKANRAFAAELLAPSKSLEHRLNTRRPNLEHVEDLAQHFQVQPQVIRYQLLNHRLVDRSAPFLHSDDYEGIE